MRALVVDDREENRYLLCQLLRGHGYAVQEADQGVQALELARAQPPDLVVSDLLMPVMDGYTLLRNWKADDTLCRIPFIVYTATYTEPKDEQLALDMGADAFIVKPAEPDVFMQRVQAVMDAAWKRQLAPRASTLPESDMLSMYNAVLVRKLEQRSLELEQRLSELNLAHQRIVRLNRLYAALSETNQAIVHTSDRNTLFNQLCRIAVERGGLRMAWVGVVHDETGEVTPVARSG
ncbi:MAG TPA: response regulator, partial [Giesbergeria sp.]|nr:response regulator [Giesbergeria sp.]